jgi:hypothetical protein
MPVANVNLTVEQIALLRGFWWHMCQRIKREQDVRYCCGAQTSTLQLAEKIGKQLNPEIEDFRNYLLEEF